MELIPFLGKVKIQNVTSDDIIRHVVKWQGGKGWLRTGGMTNANDVALSITWVGRISNNEASLSYPGTTVFTDSAVTGGTKYEFESPEGWLRIDFLPSNGDNIEISDAFVVSV